MSGPAARPRRILILSADVGEGHAAAARALAQQLQAHDGDLQITTIDGLAAMGRLLRFVIKGGYRAQLRFAPWSYTVVYWLLAHVAPCRWLARAQLCLLGSRPLLRRIGPHDPDVIVSTYPAVTVVLSRLRRVGAVRCVAAATITDLTGLFFWAQPGIDMHLVMYDESLAAVSRIAGGDRVRLVKPLIAQDFATRPTRADARRRLGLAKSGRVVVVSGGGWGVGDIAGAVRELAGMPEVESVICLAGRSEAVYRRLRDTFRGLERVEVVGFTDRMAELLAAADAIVHSTGGVTCLEARAVGTPVISYGLPAGHARVNSRAMAQVGLVRLANDIEELQEHVRASFAEVSASVRKRPQAALDGVRSAAAEILEVQMSVKAIPRWRRRLLVTIVNLVLIGGVAVWTLSTDELTGVADAVLGVHSLMQVKTSRPTVRMIVSAPSGQLRTVARDFAKVGLHASFAGATAPTRATIAAIHRLGDALVPEMPDSGSLLRWLRTSATLSSQASAAGFHHRFYFVEPPGGLTVGQLVLARAVGGTPVKGALRLSAVGRLPPRAPRRGDVVVFTVGSYPAWRAGVERIASWLTRGGLTAEPLERLSASALPAAES